MNTHVRNISAAFLHNSSSVGPTAYITVNREKFKAYNDLALDGTLPNTGRIRLSN